MTLKISDWVVFLERPYFVPQKFICLIVERDETFLNGRKCKTKDINLAYGGWNG